MYAILVTSLYLVELNSRKIFVLTIGPDERHEDILFCTEQQLWKALLFILLPNVRNNAPDCVGHGWSVVVDWHGYVAMTLLFAFTYKFTYRNVITKSNTNDRSMTFSSKCKSYVKPTILWLWYFGSVTYMHLIQRSLEGKLYSDTKTSVLQNPLTGFDAVKKSF